MNDDRSEWSETVDQVYEPRTKSYDSLRHYGLVRQVLRELDPLLKELEEFYPRMPKVDPNGNSECPFAEQWFRKKANMEAKVSKQVTVLRELRPEVSRELERCKRNLTRISVDASKVRTPVALGQYTKGFCRQEQEYLEAKWQLSEVDTALQRAEATLTASRQKAYPIPLSGEWKPNGLPASASSYPVGGSGGCVNREVNDLFSLGRIPPRQGPEP